MNQAMTVWRMEKKELNWTGLWECTSANTKNQPLLGYTVA